jgi:hypothetical protein
VVPVLTPHGHLILSEDRDASALEPELARRLQNAFARGSGHGLLQLGASEVEVALPLVFSYWREFGARYVTALCTRPDGETRSTITRNPSPPDAELAWLALAAPPMTGAEYLTASVLQSLWQELDIAFGLELSESKCGIQEFLKRCNAAWNLVGRVHFNLAENRKDGATPFAFLAYHSTVGPGQGATSSARAGSRRICGRGQQGSPAVAASPRSESLGKLLVAESHGRCGRDLSPLAVEAVRGHAASARCSATGECGRSGANASDLAGQPTSAPAGNG